MLYNTNFSYSSQAKLLKASSELAYCGSLDTIDNREINFDSLINFIMELPINMSIEIANKCQAAWFDDYSKDIYNALSRELNHDTINV